MNTNESIVALICFSCLLLYLLLVLYAAFETKRADRKRAAFAARLKKSPGNFDEIDFRENSQNELSELFGSKKGISHGSGSNVHSKR